MSPKLGLAALALLALGAALVPGGAQSSAAAAPVSFRMVEWDILPLTATKTRPGKVTFVVRNAGRLEHEFVVMKTSSPAGSLAAAGATKAPEQGVLGEIEEIPAGTTKRLTLALPAGHFSLICNLPRHYGQGQFVDFYVRP
ncbi:MAG TPA: hypothetical protein VNK94_01465 [Gaiellaceae bacterium]|nr:hypothetical protein [Gaiellaceae bacterium]